MNCELSFFLIFSYMSYMVFFIVLCESVAIFLLYFLMPYMVNIYEL